MTLDDASRIVKFIVAAYPQAGERFGLGDETTKLYLLYLRPLPRDWAFERIKKLVLSSKWPPTIAELMEALDVNDGTSRQALLDAVQKGGELVRELRTRIGTADPSSWTLRLPDAPVGEDRPALPMPTIGKGVRLAFREDREAAERARRAASLAHERAARDAELAELARLAATEPMPRLPGESA